MKRGQAIIEHMVIFEVFIVAGVIVITALGILPKIGASTVFRSSAEIISVGDIGLLNHEFDECGGYILEFRNNNPKTISLNTVTINNDQILDSAITISPGDTTEFEGITAYREKPKTDYEFYMSITYTDETAGGERSETFKDSLYGDYKSFRQIGQFSILRQRLLADYCFTREKRGESHLGNQKIQFEGNPSWIKNGDYYALVLDGEDDYGNMGTLFTNNINELTIEMAFKTDFNWKGDREKGILYKPNSFYLNALKDYKIRFGIIDGGNIDYVDSTPLENNTWYVVTTQYDGDSIQLFIDGKFNNGKTHIGGIDGSSHNTYIGTFTPETGRNLAMALGHITIFNKDFGKERIIDRQNILKKHYVNKE